MIGLPPCLVVVGIPLQDLDAPLYDFGVKHRSKIFLGSACFQRPSIERAVNIQIHGPAGEGSCLFHPKNVQSN